jgi:uncharacterized membrane protein
MRKMDWIVGLVFGFMGVFAAYLIAVTVIAEGVYEGNKKFWRKQEEDEEERQAEMKRRQRLTP